MIRIKRVYEPMTPSDGRRFLVDRLWPRGMKRDALAVEHWLKDVAPSDALRRWFAHDPKKCAEFQRRYRAELDRKPESWRPLVEAARAGTITLLFAARDPERNNAVVLKAYVEAKIQRA